VLHGDTLALGSRVDVVAKRRTSDGLPVLAFTPVSLQSALLLQCAQSLISGAEIRECEECGTWFESGGGKGKRADAHFCSAAHRIRFKNRRNAIARKTAQV
jgi:hypothetical protein